MKGLFGVKPLDGMAAGYRPMRTSTMSGKWMIRAGVKWMVRGGLCRNRLCIRVDNRRNGVANSYISNLDHPNASQVKKVEQYKCCGGGINVYIESDSELNAAKVFAKDYGICLLDNIFYVRGTMYEIEMEVLYHVKVAKENS